MTYPMEVIAAVAVIVCLTGLVMYWIIEKYERSMSKGGILPASP